MGQKSPAGRNPPTGQTERKKNITNEVKSSQNAKIYILAKSRVIPCDLAFPDIGSGEPRDHSRELRLTLDGFRLARNIIRTPLTPQTVGEHI